MGDLKEFVSKAELVTMTGWHPRAVDRRISAEGVEVFRDPNDHRRRLIRRQDVPRLVLPIPIRRRDVELGPSVA